MEKPKIRVLITGANGYVGAGIYVYLKKAFDTIGTYYSNKLFSELLPLDITDANAVETTITENKPNWIVHVAANPSGKWCDAHPKEAALVNEQGVKHIVEAANKISAKVIYISSLAAINPASLYGKTKLAGEEAVKQTKAGWVILQPSLIIGYSPNTSNDRPFNRMIKNITENTPASYDTSWKFQPTELRHVSEIIQRIIERGVSKEIIPICVPELKTRFDVAKNLLSTFNIPVTPKDEHDTSQSLKANQEALERLHLPVYTYNQIISRIIKETKEALKR